MGKNRSEASRARDRERNKERWASDPEWRERRRAQVRNHMAKNRQDPEYVAKQRAYNAEYREVKNEAARERYKTDPEYRANILKKAKERRQKKTGRPGPGIGTCSICRKYVRVVSDHCHKTGKFRGRLCGKCNSGIGFLGDDVDIVRAALAYLLTFEANNE